MKYQEAIDGLEYLISGDCTDNQQSFVDEIEIAIKALEKQMPKKAIIRPTRNFFKDERCPNCKSLLMGHHNFCKECGQALDWSE